MMFYNRKTAFRVFDDRGKASVAEFLLPVGESFMLVSNTGKSFLPLHIKFMEKNHPQPHNFFHRKYLFSLNTKQTICFKDEKVGVDSRNTTYKK